MLTRPSDRRGDLKWSIITPRGAEFTVTVPLYLLGDQVHIDEMTEMLYYLDRMAEKYNKPAWPETTNGEVPGIENLSIDPDHTVGHLG